MEAEKTMKKVTEENAGNFDFVFATLVGACGGMLRGLYKEAIIPNEVRFEAGTHPDIVRQHIINCIKGYNNRCLHGGIDGGIRYGASTAAFYFLQNVLAEKRGVHDVLNTLGAGSVTGAIMGLTLQGSPRLRMKNAALGSILGADSSVPFDWIQMKLQEKFFGTPVNLKQSGADADDRNGGTSTKITWKS